MSSRKKPKGSCKTRQDAGHTIPPAPHPITQHHPDQTAFQSIGIVCPNPECRRQACGRVPSEVKAKLKRSKPDYKPKYIAYTRYRPCSIYRIRVCLFCGRRFRTVERIESNAS